MGIKRIAILGGGISGLASLHFIQKIHPGLEIILYESKDVLGGNIQTIRNHGYLFETGPNGFINSVPSTLELMDDLGLSAQLITADPFAKRRYIQVDGRLHLLPADPKTFIKTPLLSTAEKLRLIAGIFKKKVSTDQSVHDYVCERFCPGVANRLADPFLRGIFGGDIKRLHMGYAFPKMKKGVMTSLYGGMGIIFDAFAKRYQRNIKYSTLISRLTQIDADLIISTVPALEAAKLSGIHELERLRYCAVSVVGLAFAPGSLERSPDGFGYLIPSDQGKDVLGVLIESNVYVHRAPKEAWMLRVMIGQCGDHDKLLAIALKEVGASYGIKTSPLQTWVQQWPRAIPQYETDYGSIIKEIKTNEGRMLISGNFIGGISFNDCINNAKAIANSLKV